MATAVSADPEPQSLEALKRRLRKARKSISLSTLQNLTGSMPNRLKAVIKKQWRYHSIGPTNSEHGQRHR